MDELAIELGMDPIELRVRNEPERRSRERACRSAAATWWRACARAPRASAGRAATPRPARGATGAGSVGTGVAASTYPAYRRPSQASARLEPDGTLHGARSRAADIGTGARTALTQIAADALEVAPERVRVEIGDSALPAGAGGRRLDGHRLVGLGGGQGLPGAARRGSTRRRRVPAEGSRRRRHHRGRRGAGALRAARLRRAVRRGRGWTPTPARSASRGCSASSPPGASSTPRPPARSSSAA